MKRYQKIVLWSVGSLVFLTAFIGFLHTPAARPFLVAFGVGCPVLNADPHAVAAIREHGLQQLRGANDANSRPALGLALDQTTLEQARGWAEAHELTCEQKARGFTLLVCARVPVAALPATSAGQQPIDELTLSFDLSNRLIQVSTMRRALTSVEAVELVNGIADHLTRRLGEPSERSPQSSAEYLASGPLHTSYVHYRFRNYLASITATNFPGESGGVAVREMYGSASRAM